MDIIANYLIVVFDGIYYLGIYRDIISHCNILVFFGVDVIVVYFCLIKKHNTMHVKYSNTT